MRQQQVMSKTTTLWIAGLMMPGLLWAGMANVPTQWESGLENWSAASQNNAMRVTNQNGAVVLGFGSAATMPGDEEGKFSADESASYGMYAGDLLNIGTRGVTFRATGYGVQLSYMFLEVEALDGKIWTHSLVPPQANETTVYDVPIRYGSWLYKGKPGLASDFSNSFNSVKSLSIKIMRSASLLAHGCIVDDFKLIGPTFGGSAQYAGEQAGTTVRILAEAVSAPVQNQSVPRSYTASATAPIGTFQIDDMAAPQAYRLKAFLDVNGDGILDFWEPRGEWSQGEFVFTSKVDSAEITLTDPGTADGVPYWWLVKNCGAKSEEQIRGKNGNDWIREWAGDKFTVRIVNLGNGQVALRWKHIPGKQFQIEGGEAPAGAALLERGAPVQSLNSTGEEENELIQSITESPAQFYRVKLIMP